MQWLLTSCVTDARGTIAPQWSGICIGSSRIPGCGKNDNSQRGKEWVTARTPNRCKISCHSPQQLSITALTKSDTPEGDSLCCPLISTEASQQAARWGSLPGNPRLLQPASILDNSKNSQAWKVGAPCSLGRLQGRTGHTELASNLYQLGSDQLV